MERAAIPMLDEAVAPCFEVARLFMIAEIEGDKVLSSSLKECIGCEGYGRVRLLFEQGIDILICSGIKAFYKGLLDSSGMKIISGASGQASEILDLFAAGLQVGNAVDNGESGTVCQIPHDDLVCWTRDLFESNGYRISAGEELRATFIDFVAEISCPICRKSIRVAICCGAHTYNPEHEIREFHYASPSKFETKVFVFPGSSHVEKTCREYGIELIDPNSREESREKGEPARIPLLKTPIPGHEKAFRPL